MDRLNELYTYYSDKLINWLMTWYAGLSYMEQMVALFVLFIIVVGLVASIVIKKVTG
jgi:hypothetical protein